MSNERIDSLPVLISRKAFLEVSGLGWRSFAALVAEGAIRRWVPPGGRYAKYYREDLRRLATQPPTPKLSP